MFKFHCHKCKETFRISIQRLFNKQSIICNNCGRSLPDEAVSSLRNLGESYMNAIDVLYNTGEHNQCWSISIETDTSLLPSEVPEYEFYEIDNDRKTSSYWPNKSNNKKKRVTLADL